MLPHIPEQGWQLCHLTCRPMVVSKRLCKGSLTRFFISLGFTRQGIQLQVILANLWLEMILGIASCVYLISGAKYTKDMTTYTTLLTSQTNAMSVVGGRFYEINFWRSCPSQDSNLRVLTLNFNISSCSEGWLLWWTVKLKESRNNDFENTDGSDWFWSGYIWSSCLSMTESVSGVIISELSEGTFLTQVWR